MPFGIGPFELIVVLVIALLVLGPGKLPDVGSALGKSIREFRKAATDIEDAAKIDAPPTPTPVAPVAPTATVESATPTAPVAPVAPAATVESAAPTAPVAPVAPAPPVASAAPATSIQTSSDQPAESRQ